MSRLTNTIVNSSWVCPAGVTKILLQPCNSTGSILAVQAIPVDVVPGTTYTVTINASTYTYGTTNTFGSVYTWTGSSHIKIVFVE